MNNNFEQLGGFESIAFFLIAETSNWPIVLNDETAGLIVHSDSFLDDFGVITDGSIDVNIIPKQSAEGTVYPIEVLFTFLNRTQALENYLDQYQNKPVVVIATLNTGLKKIYGTPLEPLFLNYKIDEGKKAEDPGVISVSIKGETRNRPVFYNV